MPRIKPSEFEDRPAIVKANPDDHLSPGAPLSRPFKVVSALAGCSLTICPGVLMPVVTDVSPLENARVESIGVFCVMAYVFLQFAGITHQRHQLDTRRARVYFYLLAFFPLWGFPAAWTVTEIIVRLGFHFL